MFPVGALSKPEVREHARRLALNGRRQAGQPGNLLRPRRRLRLVRRAHRRPRSIAAAPSSTNRATTLGRHGGVHRFTVGQRKGLGLSSPAPLYVLKIDAETRAVTVGPRAALDTPSLTAAGVNWIAVDAPADWLPGVRADPPSPPPPHRAALRARDEAAPSSCSTSRRRPSPPARRWCSTTATWWSAAAGSTSHARSPIAARRRFARRARGSAARRAY